MYDFYRTPQLHTYGNLVDVSNYGLSELIQTLGEEDYEEIENNINLEMMENMENNDENLEQAQAMPLTEDWNRNEKLTAQELQTLQRQADEAGVLMPTQFNINVENLANKERQIKDENQVLLQPGLPYQRCKDCDD